MLNFNFTIFVKCNLQELHNEKEKSKELLFSHSYSLCLGAISSANHAQDACRGLTEVLTCQRFQSFVGTLLRCKRVLDETCGNLEGRWKILYF